MGRGPVSEPPRRAAARTSTARADEILGVVEGSGVLCENVLVFFESLVDGHVCDEIWERLTRPLSVSSE